jgi:hypothetical protein
MPAAARKTAAPKTVNAAKAAEAVHEEKTEDEEPKVNTFEYKGTTYSVPADPLDLPLEVGLAESEFEIAQEIVGPDQWLEFRKTRPTIRQFQAFLELALEAAGYGDSGN